MGPSIVFVVNNSCKSSITLRSCRHQLDATRDEWSLGGYQTTFPWSLDLLEFIISIAGESGGGCVITLYPNVMDWTTNAYGNIRLSVRLLVPHYYLPRRCWKSP
jgi:hypothetical protein